MMTELLQRQKWVAIAAATVVLSVMLTLASPVFLTFSNFQGVLIQSSVTAIMAIGMTYIILSGGIDISMGAILFFTSALFAQLMLDTNSYLLSFSAAIACATLLGALNGFLVIRFRMSPLITTLLQYIRSHQ